MACISSTSYSKGFNIFNKVSEEEFDISNKNFLRMFMLNTSNKLFNYDEMYEYILPNVAKYVFSRKRFSQIEKDDSKYITIILEALDHLRKIYNDTDDGAGGELGEILLYLFLECHLKAPKLLSKVQLKTNSQDYVKGCDGIHCKFRINNEGEKILQIVIGEAKIQNDLKKAIENALSSIDRYLSNNTQDINLLNTHLMDQIFDEEEAELLKGYILQKPRKPTETIFGIFIGYTITYDGTSDTNDVYAKKVIEENIKQVMELKAYIIKKIKEYRISNYEFNFYFLPFLNAARVRKVIMKSLTSGKSKLEWGEIRNG